MHNRFRDSKRKLHIISDSLTFQNAFRLGARIGFEVMADGDL